MAESDDYHAMNDAMRETASGERKLQKLEDRSETGVFTVENWRPLFEAKYKTKWRGMILMKGAFEIITYQQLFWDVKPRTVLEFGANAGGSAVWMADTLQMFGCKSHVYSVDIDLSLLEPLAREKRDDLTFFQGDCNEIQKTFTPEMLKSFPHPWFVTEDAHVNVVGVLDYIDQFTEPGDYIIIEDTNPVSPANITSFVRNGGECETLWRGKLDELNEFVRKHPDRYRVDKGYTDFFGYNNSSNMNSYLRRI